MQYQIKNSTLTFFTSVSLVLLVSALHYWGNLPMFFENIPLQYLPPFDETINASVMYHHGGEIGCIAGTLVNGGGFSNPFCAFSGPTAWMPPLLPYLLSWIIRFVRDSDKVTSCLFYLQGIAVCISSLALYYAARRTNTAQRSLVFIPLILLCLLGTFFWQFQLSHDVPYVAVLINLGVAFLSTPMKERQLLRELILASLLTALMLFTNVAAATAWVLILAIRWRTLTKRWNEPKITLAVTLSSLLWIIPFSLWTWRNYTVFDAFVPIKSNFFYDAYQANYGLTRGVYSTQDLSEHPYWETETNRHADFVKMGEKKFLEEYRQSFQKEFHNNPQQLLYRMGERLWAFTFGYPSHGLDGAAFWWWIQWAINCLSTLAIMYLLVTKSSPQIKTILWFGILYVIPYVLFAYYDRYGAPLAGIRALALFWVMRPRG